MTWVKIDDGFYDNVTNRALGAAGRDLYIAGLCFCSKGLTDGRIPKTDVPLLLAQAQAKPAAVRKLVDAGRWTDDGDSYQVVAYLEYNPSRQRTEEQRADVARKKSEAGKKGAQARWHRNGSADSSPDDRPDGSVPSDSHGTADGPVPSRPQKQSSSVQRSNRGDPNAPDDDLDPKTTPALAVLLVADRRIDLEHPDGAGIDNPKSYSASVQADHFQRFKTAAETLHDEHPDWTVEQLADELDPGTATTAGNYLDRDESQAWLHQHDQAAASAVPMPDSVKAALEA